MKFRIMRQTSDRLESFPDDQVSQRGEVVESANFLQNEIAADAESSRAPRHEEARFDEETPVTATDDSGNDIHSDQTGASAHVVPIVETGSDSENREKSSPRPGKTLSRDRFILLFGAIALFLVFAGGLAGVLISQGGASESAQGIAASTPTEPPNTIPVVSDSPTSTPTISPTLTPSATLKSTTPPTALPTPLLTPPPTPFPTPSPCESCVSTYAEIAAAVANATNKTNPLRICVCPATEPIDFSAAGRPITITDKFFEMECSGNVGDCVFEGKDRTQLFTNRHPLDITFAGESHATFRKIKFQNGFAEIGGALDWVGLGFLGIYDCHFDSNEATLLNNGAALWIHEVGGQLIVDIRDSTFSNNIVSRLGGGMWMGGLGQSNASEPSSLIIDNNRFIGNRAIGDRIRDVDGGGAGFELFWFNSSNAYVQVTGNFFEGNTADVGPNIVVWGVQLDVCTSSNTFVGVVLGTYNRSASAEITMCNDGPIGTPVLD